MIQAILSKLSEIKESILEKIEQSIPKLKELLETAVDNLISMMPEIRLKLRHKVMMMFSIIAIPSILFMILTFALINNTISSQMDGLHNAIVTGSHKMVEHYILNCQKGLTTLGSEKIFRMAVGSRDREQLKRSLKRIYVKHKTFSFLGVVGKDKSGKLYMASSWPDGYGKLTESEDINKFLKYNFSNPMERVSNAYVYDDKREVLLVYPLRGALLIGGVNLDNLSQLLMKTKPYPESAFILLDGDKKLIFGNEEQFNDQFSGDSGVITFDKNKNIAYYAKNPAVNWYVMLSSPYGVVFKSVMYLKWLVILFVSLSIITALILAFYFTKRVTLPIAHLNKGAKILGAGNLAYRIKLNTGDEIEVLAKEFNSMAEELKKSYDSLGEKIKNATRDLEDAYSEIDDKNKELQKADKLKSEFLASMSHELRTPMNAIIGFTSLLEDGVYGKVSKRQKDTFGKVMRNTRHLLNLINDILDLSKIEAGRMKLVPEHVKLNLLLSDLFEEVKPLAQERGLDFIMDNEEDINCHHDYTRLRQVIMNLLSNAIKFTKDGWVRLSSGIDNEKFYVEISDSGIGIKEEDLKHIFDEFIQADGSITREFGGTGLGLSICKKLVKMMGGDISVESEWEKGSVFRLLLPFDLESGE